MILPNEVRLTFLLCFSHQLQTVSTASVKTKSHIDGVTHMSSMPLFSPICRLILSSPRLPRIFLDILFKRWRQTIDLCPTEESLIVPIYYSFIFGSDAQFSLGVLSPRRYGLSGQRDKSPISPYQWVMMLLESFEVVRSLRNYLVSLFAFGYDGIIFF